LAADYAINRAWMERRSDNRRVNARFFVPGTYGAGDRIELPTDEAQHLTRVLRLRDGDPVRIFDGRGHEFAATIATVAKSGVTVVVGASHPPVAEAHIAITLAQAVLKGDKMDDAIRDGVMIGATAIQPIVSARTEVTLAALERGQRRERWGRVAVSSVKQCGRAVVPAILAPMTLDDLLDALGQLTLPQPAIMLVEPSAAADGVQSLADLDPAPPREATLIIGPEGGWTPQEVERAAAVCRLVKLGGRTLRADAMAVVAMAALFTRWGEY
jgi:16S rRNA (uracil1498-N3)-methyltransferase